MAKISDPIRIRNLEIKNRFFAAPMISNTVREDCCAGKTLIDATYYRAKGGWGLYSVEGSLPTENTKLFPRMLGCFDDNQVIALYELVEAIHAGGAKAMMQVTHPGRVANPERLPKHVRRVAFAPSDTTPPNPFPPYNKPVAMTEEDIEELIGEYVKSVVLAKAAGFDIYELHCSHGTLPQQFMSPYTNHRDDDWGGDWERRMNFVCRILSRMREAVGDFPIACRVAGDEFMEGGYTIDDFCKHIAPAMQAAGCDMFDVTCGLFEHFHTITPEIYEPRGLWVYLAERVKQVVDVPVAGLGRINDGRMAAELIEAGKFDIVGIGRGSLADAQFAQKTLEGRYDDIRRCIACNSCLEDDFSNRPSRCAVNFEYNRPSEWWEDRMLPARTPKKIMVVGGGPAGMEFARLARQRGHDVTIYEKNKRLGGYLPLAASFPKLNTKDVLNINRWLIKEIKRLDINVEFEVMVTPELVNEKKPDVVVLATGSKEILPDIPGVDGAGVGTLDEFLSGKKRTGRRVAVVGGHYGVELAVSLAREGKSDPEGYTKYHRAAEERALDVVSPDNTREVTILEEGDMIGWPPYFQMLRFMVINEFLAETGVTCMPGTKVTALNDGSLSYTDGEGNEGTLAVDTVIFALPRLANRDLYDQLVGTGVQIREIGDCAGPEKVEKAIHMANYLARQL